MTHRQRLSTIVVALLAALGLSFAGGGVAGAAPSAPAAAPPVAALATPITGTADNGSFAGSLTPARVSGKNGHLLAAGVLTGTARCSSGVTIGTIPRPVSMPVTVAAATCQVLNLVLG